MKRNQDKELNKIIGAIIFLLVISFVCIVFANCMTANSASILGGVLSALATVFLGVIAFWQNKRYKELSDEMNDTMLMPEVYQSTEFSDELQAPLEQYRPHVKGFIDMNSDYKWTSLIHLNFLRGPIINLYAKRIQSGSEELSFISSQKISMRDETVPFNLSFEVPAAWIGLGNPVTVTLAYENIYGTQYEKDLCITLYPDSLEVDTMSLERARRICNG